jgi:uncharacterized membrane protein
MGERYRRFVEQTSFMPGAALLSGRQHFDPAEDVPWLAILIGTVLTIVLVAIHPWAFGGHPLGKARPFASDSFHALARDLFAGEGRVRVP